MSQSHKGKPSSFKNKHHTKESIEKNRLAHLGKPGYWLGKKRSEESKERMSKCYKCRGINHYRWKGKIHKDRGYVRIFRPKHPFCDYRGRVLEHRLIMEKYLGRYLKPEERIHHIDKIRNNNKIENLKLFFNQSQHLKHHNLFSTDPI